MKNMTFREVIQKYASEKEYQWVEEKSNQNNDSFTIAFITTTRNIEKKIIEESIIIENIYCKNYTLDQVVRIFFIVEFEKKQPEKFEKQLHNLFETAENNEGVALIKSLQFLQNPEKWLLKATDAVRSNVGIIFDSIAFQNTFPKNHFSELAWNQMVLKCIFNDKSIKNIDGLEERTNKELAYSISHLAHERWAAGRTIPDYAWRIVAWHLDDQLMDDILKLFTSNKESDQIIASLICDESTFDAAKQELQKHDSIVSTRKKINWENFN